jgi:hypothetical protein
VCAVAFTPSPLLSSLSPIQQKGGAGGASTGVIEATSQVSRFHTETLDGAGGSGVGGVELKGVQLSVDGKVCSVRGRFWWLVT